MLSSDWTQRAPLDVDRYANCLSVLRQMQKEERRKKFQIKPPLEWAEGEGPLAERARAVEAAERAAAARGAAAEGAAAGGAGGDGGAGGTTKFFRQTCCLLLQCGNGDEMVC